MDYKLIRSRRKTLGLELRGGEVIVRAPLRCPESDIDRFVQSREDWIAPRLAAQREALSAAAAAPIGKADIAALCESARAYIPGRAAFYAEKLEVTYKSITIRCQKTRWGSCSNKGGLSFNCLLMLAPPDVIDSVIVHELAHLKHFDHSPAFYGEVLRVFPDYKSCSRWLSTEGRTLLMRAHS